MITFNLDEYCPIENSHPNSYHHQMHKLLFNTLKKINPTFNPEKNSFIPNGATKNVEKESAQYEEKIKQYGWLDLQILGIGTNRHIGFNEPNSDKKTKTRLVNLNQETIRINAYKFFDRREDLVPKKAISMGIETILKAKEIFLMALGKTKIEIMHKLSLCKKPIP